MTIDWPKFAKIVGSHDKFLLTSHVRPDCDGLGSELALAQVLESLGKSVTIVNGQATPPNLEFVDPQRRIKVLDQHVRREELNDIEVLIILDTSSWAQLGPMGELVRWSDAIKLIIDHHVSEEDLGAEAFKDTSAEATGRLVVDAAEQLGVPLTPEIAMPLFAAVATDTGWFRFASTTAGTYRVAARLVEAGAVPADIYRELYEQDTAARMRLRGLILSRIVSELDGRLQHTHVLKEDFERTGAHPSDTEDVINAALAIAGTQFAVILVEQKAGGFKISFRSRCPLDCSRIAERFNGGGHKAAAGAWVEGSLADVQHRVLDVVREALSKLGS